MKFIFSFKFLWILLSLMVITGLAGFYTLNYYFKAPRVQSRPQYIIIDVGQSRAQIAATLVQKQLFTNRLMIIFNILIQGYSRKLKAGEYLIPTKFSLQHVLDLIAAGRAALHTVTIPEGLSSCQIQDLLNHHPLLTGPHIDHISEGTLMPETYLVPRNTPRIKFIKLMKQAMDHYLLSISAHNYTSLTIDQVVILASIVEKETAQPYERNIIASVFFNRLKINMPLQSDPTVVYALGQLKGKPHLNALSHKDLKTQHPINTYTNNGLPPHPICHPGKAAIEAVLNPANTTYLYFVADGTGAHIFASSLAQHTINHQNWRRMRSKSVQ